MPLRSPLRPSLALLAALSPPLAFGEGKGKTPKAGPDTGGPIIANALSDREVFILGNMLITLYHELAHGMDDVLGLPTLGREEDAADSFAIVELVMQIKSEATDGDTDALLARFGRSSAEAWLKGAQERGTIEQSAYFGPHALDQQRMFQTTCLLVGGLPEMFKDLPEQMGISDYYTGGCEAFFFEAYDGWVYMIDTFGGLEGSNPSPREDLIFTFEPAETREMEVWRDLAMNWPQWAEVQRHFSTSFKLERPFTVSFESCGQENAFYYPGEGRVTMCYELMGAYARYADLPLEVTPTSNPLAGVLGSIGDEG